MAELFSSVDETRMKLDETVCTYDGEAVYVNVRSVLQVSILKLTNSIFKKNDPEIVAINDPKFSYQSPPLGFCQIPQNKDVVYIMRQPYRQNQAGLSANNLITEPWIEPGYYFPKSNLGDCIKGNYFNLPNALDALINGANGVAIHRHVAVRNLDKYTVGLYYKARLIGNKNDHSNVFRLKRTQQTSFLYRILNKHNLGLELEI